MLVEGGAGMGKTRLVAEALGDHPELTVSSMRGEPYGSAIPYRAVRDAVRQLARRRAGRAGDHGPRNCSNTSEQLAPDLVPLAPLVAEVAHVPVPSTPRSTRSSPDSVGTAQADAIVGLVRARSKGPLVLVVDDAHWVDEASAHLLSQLVVADRRQRAAVHRGWSSPSAAALDGGFEPDSDPVVTVATTPARRRRGAGVVGHRVGHRCGRTRSHAIVSRAAGNPLYLQEIAAAGGADG